MFQDVVLADCSQEDEVTFQIEGDAATPAHAGLPNICGAFHLLHAQAGMTKITFELLECAIHPGLEAGGELPIISFEPGKPRKPMSCGAHE